MNRKLVDLSINQTDRQIITVIIVIITGMDLFDDFDFDSAPVKSRNLKTFKKQIDIDLHEEDSAPTQDDFQATQIIQDITTEVPSLPPMVSTSSVSFLSDAVLKARRRLNGEGVPDESLAQTQTIIEEKEEEREESAVDGSATQIIKVTQDSKSSSVTQRFITQTQVIEEQIVEEPTSTQPMNQSQTQKITTQTQTQTIITREESPEQEHGQAATNHSMLFQSEDEEDKEQQQQQQQQILQRIQARAEEKRRLRLLKEQQEREKDGNGKVDQPDTTATANALDHANKGQEDEYRSEDEDYDEERFENLEAVSEVVITREDFFGKLGVNFTKREFKRSSAVAVPATATADATGGDLKKEEDKAKQEFKEEQQQKDGEEEAEEKEVEIITLDSDTDSELEITAVEKFTASLKFSTNRQPNGKKHKKQDPRKFSILALRKLAREQERQRKESDLNKKMLRDIELINQEFKESDDVLERHFRIEKGLREKEKSQKRRKNKKASHNDSESEDEDYLDGEEVPDSDFSEEDEQEIQLSQGKRKAEQEQEEDEISYASDKTIKAPTDVPVQIVKRRRVNVIEDEEDQQLQPSLIPQPQLSQLFQLDSLNALKPSDLPSMSQLFDQLGTQKPSTQRTDQDTEPGNLFAKLRSKANEEELLKADVSFIGGAGGDSSFASTQQHTQKDEEGSLDLGIRKDSLYDFDINAAAEEEGEEQGNLSQRKVLNTQDLDVEIDAPTQIDQSQMSVTQINSQGQTQKIIAVKKTQSIKIAMIEEEEQEEEESKQAQSKEEEGEAESSDDDDDDEEERLRLAEMYRLQRQQEHDLHLKKRQELKSKGLDEIMEDQAEESEDEYQGLGGIDGERDDLDVANSDDEAMYDDITKVKESRAEYVAKHIEEDIQKDQELNKALLTAVERGGLQGFDFRNPERALEMLKKENMLRKMGKINAIREKYNNGVAQKKNKRGTGMNDDDDDDEFAYMLDANADVIPDSSDEEEQENTQDVKNKHRNPIQSKHKKRRNPDSDLDDDYLLSTSSFSRNTNPTLRSIQSNPSFQFKRHQPQTTTALSEGDYEEDDHFKHHEGLVELPTTRRYRVNKLPDLERNPNEVIITTSSKTFGSKGTASIMSLGKRIEKKSAINSGLTRVLKAGGKGNKKKKEVKQGRIVSVFKAMKKDDDDGWI